MTTVISAWLISISLFSALVWIVIHFSRKYQSKKFNNGFCPRCNIRWEQSYMDSQGGRSYRCERCTDTVWITTNVDKDFLKEERQKFVEEQIKAWQKKHNKEV